jgi:hypothetical protein
MRKSCLVFLGVLLGGIGCMAEGPPPPLVGAPPEAQEMLVYLNPEIHWVDPSQGDETREWGNQLMKELATELTAHGFVLVADANQKHELTLGVALQETARLHGPMKADLYLKGSAAAPDHVGDVSVTCSAPAYAARVLANRIVASGYFNEVVRYRHVQPAVSSSGLL